jgi:Zn-dependent M28 family amino/carboxypeptidase
MEAVRILSAIDVDLDRTVRVALWSAEEQGLLGSRYHVREHFADRPETTDPDQLALPRNLREPTWPIQTKNRHDDFWAYFNLDNGAGRIRGIRTQENVAAGELFRRWLQPVADLGAETVTNRNTGGTDHLAFDAVGLPGFQFVQDGMDYWPRTHHTQLDVIDHVVEEDLKVSSVILAWFLYKAATMDDRFPRKPLPTAPPEE